MGYRDTGGTGNRGAGVQGYMGYRDTGLLWPSSNPVLRRGKWAAKHGVLYIDS